MAIFVAGLTALTQVLYPPNPTASVSLSAVKVMKGRSQSHQSNKLQQYAFINFDLDADFSTLWNWNTKQVFAWVSVVYNDNSSKPTPVGKHTDNEVIIWDAILTEREDALVSIVNEKAKYNFNDISGRFGQRNATLRVGWNLQPHVGALVWGTIDAPFEGVGGAEHFTF